MEQFFIFLIGAFGYSLMEILWRGYTHWTMAVTGGICFMLLFYINSRFPNSNVLFKSLLGAAAITAVEFVVGVTVNLVLKWNVWDYSRMPANVLGQICLPYTLLWFFMCIPLMNLCGAIKSLG